MSEVWYIVFNVLLMEDGEVVLGNCLDSGVGFCCCGAGGWVCSSTVSSISFI